MANDRVKHPHIVTIGGGTGTFASLSGLKNYPVSLTAIVSMSDSGGSNKRIRDEFGLLPTSDIRQSLIALSAENGRTNVLRDLFMYRFEKGEGIKGMTFGNLFMAALSDILGSQEKAIQATAKVLRINGTVVPVTLTNTNLHAMYENGDEVTEEHFIDEPTHDGKLRITDLYLTPKAKPNPYALEKIAKADLIVLGPGDLYTSLLPNVVVEGVAKAIKRSKAKKIYIMNLMTKYGQTYNFTAADHIAVLEKYIGKSIDYVVINTRSFPQMVLTKYERMHEYPVVDDLPAKAYYKVIRKPVASKAVVEKSKADGLVRSLIRHDSNELAKALIALI